MSQMIQRNFDMPDATRPIHEGHDAWVIGDEPMTAMDFRGAPFMQSPKLKTAY